MPEEIEMSEDTNENDNQTEEIEFNEDAFSKSDETENEETEETEEDDGEESEEEETGDEEGEEEDETDADREYEDYLNSDEDEEESDDEDSEEKEDEDDDDSTEDEESEGGEQSPSDKLRSRINEIEDEKKEDSIFDESVSDDALYMGMLQVKDYNDWMRASEQETGEVDMNFARVIAQNNIDPAQLAKDKIFGFSDYFAYTQALEEKADDETIVVPRQDDEEGWAIFNKEVLGIHDKPEDYGEEIFQDTFLQDNEDAKAHLRQRFVEGGYTEVQAHNYVTDLDEERRAVEETSYKDFQDYKKKQTEILEDEYGEDYQNTETENIRFLQSFPAGKDLIKEFKNTKFLDSASFFNLLSELRESGEVQTPRFVPTEIGATIKKLSDSSLIKRFNTLLDDKYMDEKYEDDPKHRAKHRKVYNLALKLDKEINRRGLQ